ncbi:6-phosphogluconolactonase [Microbacterium sp. SS28]|uniref:6-phosphogluconolactonase n=1 Tax=Microbacterium sp. SS28 TaxID=2919948 RepID=UPI001FA9D657|nr:6-phosphogluconolactonase [Microbacterium sp. SS28]
MAEFWTEKRVVISSDPASLAESVAARLVSRLVKQTTEGLDAHISLTGGSMGSAVLAAAARHPRLVKVDWARVHFWWSDERWVPRNHADRNEKQAREALLDAIDIPGANIHAIAASGEGVELDAAAEAYAAELARFGSAEGDAWPSFDICFLGVGPDAHIASLFPDRREIQVTDKAVLPVRDSPKPPPERITMTRPVINSSQRVWLVLSGADKASALGLALAGASYQSVPAAGAKGRRRTIFFVDDAAASQVPHELITGEY